MKAGWSSCPSLSLSCLSCYAIWSLSVPRKGVNGHQPWIPGIAEGLDLISQAEQWLFAVAVVSAYTHSSCVLDTISWAVLDDNVALRKVSFTQPHHHHNLEQRLYKPLPLILWIRSHRTGNMCWSVSLFFFIQSWYSLLLCQILNEDPVLQRLVDCFL